MNRRDLLKLSASSLTYLSLPKAFGSGKTSEVNSNKENKKLVWLMLRGGMDGLHATPPLFDSNLVSLRADLIEPISKKALPLKRGFGLHPSLKFTHSLFNANQFNAIVATSTHYRKRSHFEGQDILECGLKKVDLDNGWMARALSVLESEKNNTSLAIARSLPKALRGTDRASTWYPSKFAAPSDSIHKRLLQLYEQDESLLLRLKQALETQALFPNSTNKKNHGKLSNLAASCATILKEPKGPDIAMLEMGGWDTHNNQVKQLNNQFKQLDEGIKSLHEGLGDQWVNTLLIITTEFGRTVKINGTGGTDHGTGTSMFVTGGGIEGGQVLGEWPGLLTKQLYQGRDLQPTSDTFNWIAKAIEGHLNLNKQELGLIFPDTNIQDVAQSNIKKPNYS